MSEVNERRFQVLMTREELDVVTFCLLFVQKDILEMNGKFEKLFGSLDDPDSTGAYHIINDVCERAHVAYMKNALKPEDLLP